MFGFALSVFKFELVLPSSVARAVLANIETPLAAAKIE